MKLKLLLLSVLLLASCQRSASNPADTSPEAAGKPTPQPAPVPAKSAVTRTKTLCANKSTYTFGDEVQTVKEEQTMEINESTALIFEKNGVQSRQKSGDIKYETFTVSGDGSKVSEGVVDHTFIGTYEVSFENLQDNKFKKTVTNYHFFDAGRNGYEFTVNNKKVSLRERKRAKDETTFFQDDKTYYVISRVVDGKVDKWLPNFVDTSTVKDNVETVVTKLKEPFTIDSTRYTEFEETCTIETLPPN